MAAGFPAGAASLQAYQCGADRAAAGPADGWHGFGVPLYSGCTHTGSTALTVQQVANTGASLGDVQTDVLGLLVWGFLASALCGWKFRMA